MHWSYIANIWNMPSCLNYIQYSIQFPKKNRFHRSPLSKVHYGRAKSHQSGEHLASITQPNGCLHFFNMFRQNGVPPTLVLLRTILSCELWKNICWNHMSQNWLKIKIVNKYCCSAALFSPNWMFFQWTQDPIHVAWGSARQVCQPIVDTFCSASNAGREKWV